MCPGSDESPCFALPRFGGGGVGSLRVPSLSFIHADVLVLKQVVMVCQDGATFVLPRVSVLQGAFHKPCCVLSSFIVFLA